MRDRAWVAFARTASTLRDSARSVRALKTSRIGGVKMNWVLELTGIGLVALAAWRERLKTSIKR